jgi:hypothetical protein
MPWNGAGVFQRLYNWAQDYANGIFVRYDRVDADSNDIALGISNCIARDGQAPPTTDISWGSHKITNLANGVGTNDAVNYGQVFNGGSFANAVFTGTFDASTATSFKVPSPTAGDNSQKAVPTSYLVSYYAPLASPALTGVPTAPTAAPGTNTNQIATMAALIAQAFLASLPNQAGNAGKYVTTDGATASWASVPPPPDYLLFAQGVI